MPHSESGPVDPTFSPSTLPIPQTVLCADHAKPSQMKSNTMLQNWYSEGRRENLSISEVLHRSMLRAQSETEGSS